MRLKKQMGFALSDSINNVKNPKKKLDPKIIRIGDSVKVENCMFFVRCGYPLCLEDLTNNVLERRKRELFSLIDLEFPFVKAKKYYIIDSLPINKTQGDFNDDLKEDLARQLARKIASVQIVEKKFGGSTREIYEKSIPDLKDEEFIVTDIKFVKTGTRHAGSGGGYNYFDEWEYEPPYFNCDKTYKILQLKYKDTNQQNNLEYLNLEDKDLRIQVDNVVKL